MFFVTAQLVKPVSPDDLPATHGVDGLKNGSPLGVEPKGEGIEGKSGYSIKSENAPQKPTDANTPAKEANPASASQTTPTKTVAVAATPGRNEAISSVTPTSTRPLLVPVNPLDPPPPPVKAASNVMP